MSSAPSPLLFQRRWSNGAGSCTVFGLQLNGSSASRVMIQLEMEVPKPMENLSSSLWTEEIHLYLYHGKGQVASSRTFASLSPTSHSRARSQKCAPWHRRCPWPRQRVLALRRNSPSRARNREL